MFEAWTLIVALFVLGVAENVENLQQIEEVCA